MSFRISTDQISQQALQGVDNAYASLSAALNVVNTGKQVQQPSDNPAGFTQILDFGDQISQLNQYGNVITQAQGFLTSGETALTSITSLLNEANSIGLQAANGDLSASTRQGLANQIQNIITQLGTIGNTTYGNRYIFGGQKTTSPPFVASGSGFTYQGGSDSTDDGNINFTVGTGQSLQVNVPGDQILSSLICNQAGPPPVESVLGQLQNDIADGNISQLSNTTSSSDLSALATQIDNITTVNADFGSKLDFLKQTQQNNALTLTNLQAFQSDIQDANLPQAIVNQETAQQAYQAALSTVNVSFQNSLLNYLK